MDVIHCHNQEEVTYYLNKYNLPWRSNNKGLTSAEYELKQEYYKNEPENFLLCFHDYYVAYSNTPSNYENIIEGHLPDNEVYIYDSDDNLKTITYPDNIDKYLPCIIYHNGDKLEVTLENVDEIKKILE